jgi:hypothetical protein
VEALEDRTVPSFLPPVSYSAGGPYMVVADLNNDGVPDLASAGFNSQGVNVLLGNGGGTFRAEPTAAVSDASTLVAGDFNGDDKADIVTVGSGVLNLLLGNGDGTFQPARAVSLPKGQFPSYELTTGDFNNDGKADIAVEGEIKHSSHGGGPGSFPFTYYTYYVNVLLGQADGSFVDKSPVQFDGAYLAAGDFNNDGKLDVLTSGLYLLLGKGDGSLLKPTPVAGANGSGNGAFAPLAIADLNRDGNLDIIASTNISSTGSSMCTILGNGNGTFQTPQIIFSGDLGNVVAGDFNRDGKLDIVTEEYARDSDGNVVSGSVEVELGNGNGTFQAPQTVAVSSEPGHLIAADFNGDGFLDVATVNYSAPWSDSILVLLNDGIW